MARRFVVIFLSALHVAAASSGMLPAAPRTPDQIAGQILSTYENRWNELTPRNRGHFALRIYRVSGDSRYLPQIRSHYEGVRNHLLQATANLGNPEFIKTEAAKRLAAIGSGDAKHELRAKMLEPHLEFLFHTKLLFWAYLVRSWNMHQHPDLTADWPTIEKYLKSVPFETHLMDENIIRYNAPQTVNYIFFLKFLELRDLENKFTEKFRTVLMDVEDSLLSDVEFENKIYGLTHFIIAASDYYQRTVDAEKYGWILNYFSEHFDEIIRRTKTDVIAEVGLCFKLAGLGHHPAAWKSISKVIQAYDAGKGFIDSAKHPGDLNRAEHRNIVAYMLLKDYKALYPGPDLNSSRTQ